MSKTMQDKETKEYKELKSKIEEYCRDNYSGSHEYEIDPESIYFIAREFAEKLEQEAERRGRMNTCNKIKEYVESESGKSGRKEILKYIKLY